MLGASFDHLIGAARQRNGTVMPSALAVLRLMKNSTFVAAGPAGQRACHRGRHFVLILMRALKPDAFFFA
jgi:hypothetical protein